jgi:D-glycero-D-manno-heptose 1,7-bisphosphate phosphatase
LAIQDRFGVPLSDALVVGDSLRDIEAAHAAGAAAVLVLTGKGADTLAQYGDRLALTPTYPDLAAAVDAILAT